MQRQPRPLPQLTDKALDRFHRSYVVNPATGCWEFKQRGAKNYGYFQFRSKGYRAHRLSFALHTGRDPGDLLVCHSCDNPPCINPDHLWLGDHAANLADMKAKGRHPTAKRNTGCGHNASEKSAYGRFGRTLCRQCDRERRREKRRNFRATTIWFSSVEAQTLDRLAAEQGLSFTQIVRNVFVAGFSLKNQSSKL